MQVSQIEENMNENAETRRSLARRLQQNKEAGRGSSTRIPVADADSHAHY